MEHRRGSSAPLNQPPRRRRCSAARISAEHRRGSSAVESAAAAEAIDNDNKIRLQQARRILFWCRTEARLNPIQNAPLIYHRKRPTASWFDLFGVHKQNVCRPLRSKLETGPRPHPDPRPQIPKRPIRLPRPCHARSEPASLLRLERQVRFRDWLPPRHPLASPPVLLASIQAVVISRARTSARFGNRSAAGLVCRGTAKRSLPQAIAPLIIYNAWRTLCVDNHREMQ